MLFLTVIPLKETHCYSETKLTDSAFILVKICTRLLFLLDTQKCIAMMKGERIILSCSFIPLKRLIFILFVIVHLWTLIYFLIHGNNIFIAEYNSHVINSISFLGVFFVIMFLKCLTWIFPGGWASLVAQLVKNLLAMRETWVPSLGWEHPLEKGKATHCSILVWRIPYTEQSMGLQRVGHDWAPFSTWIISFNPYNNPMRMGIITPAL